MGNVGNMSPLSTVGMLAVIYMGRNCNYHEQGFGLVKLSLGTWGAFGFGESSQWCGTKSNRVFHRGIHFLGCEFLIWTSELMYSCVEPKQNKK